MGGVGTAHVAFGSVLRAECPLPELPVAPPGADVDTEIVWADEAGIDDAFSGPADPPFEQWRELGGGARFRVERGAAGDLLIQLGETTRFHLAAGGGVVRCSPADPDDVRWRRFVLDTVLGTVALLRGYEILHAAAYGGREGVVAIVAGSGGGKSTLLAEMLRRGRPLFCDDLLVLEPTGVGAVVAHAGPPLLTVTSPLPDGTTADALGRVLAVVDGETWVHVTPTSTCRDTVAAVAFLERTGDDDVPRAEPIPASPVPLLRDTLHSGGSTDRLRARFELVSDLAATTPLVRLVASPGTSPAATADALEAAVERAGAAAP